jgi:hypothetical protein
MGIGIVLFIVAVIVLASWQYRADLNRLNKDYEEWKNNRR